MRFCLPFAIVVFLILVAQPSAAQVKVKDLEAKAERIAAIEKQLRSLSDEITRLREEMSLSDPAAKRKGNLEKEIRDLQISIALLQSELRRLQPVEPIKTGVTVSVTLQVTTVRGRMIPQYRPYGEGATIYLLTAKDQKIVAEGKTDGSSSVTLPAPPGKYLLEVIPRLASRPGNQFEVTVEKDQVTGMAVMIRSIVLKPQDPRLQIDPR